MAEADFIKLISESLDDIIYDDISDDFEDDEFYSDDDIWHHDDYTEDISLSPLDYEADDEEKSKGLTESLDDINYDDISDDSSSAEFYRKRIGGEWIIVWEDKVATGIWYVDNQNRRCGHIIEKIWYKSSHYPSHFIYDSNDDDDADIDEVNINLKAILDQENFWKYAHRYIEHKYDIQSAAQTTIDDIVTGTYSVGYWDDDNERLYSSRKKSGLEPGLSDKLIKLRWAYTEFIYEYE